SAETESRADVLLHGAFVGFGRRFGLPTAVARFHLAPMILSPRTIAEQPELVSSVVRGMRDHSRDGAALASTAVVRRTSLVDTVGTLSKPTLLVCGRDDRTTPLSKSERMRDAIRGARLVVLDDCGHISALEQPERVTAELVDFVGARGEDR
ncbi:MAG TPA: alpha/beta fold hydrolase, partial [Polyangiaceae bacterium]